MNYVECKGCDHWRSEERTKRLCARCNNSKLVADPKEILCNMCGGSMCPLGTMNEQFPHGLYKASVTGGFDSYHLFDSTTYTFNFCEKCLRNLFVQCAVKPILHDTDLDGTLTKEEDWARDQESYEYRIWKDDGGHHQAYLNRKCNEKKDCPNDAEYTVLIYNQNYSEDCACSEHVTTYKKYPGQYRIVPYISEILKIFV